MIVMAGGLARCSAFLVLILTLILAFESSNTTGTVPYDLTSVIIRGQLYSL